jgi:hypothetical protein
MIRFVIPLAALAGAVLPQEGPPPLPVERFDALRGLIRPYPGEFAWREEIPWLTSIQEAREKAAAEGKPILFWCAADGHPLTQP